jgi:four helix bundle protein
MSFENLEVWKKSSRLSAELYRELKGLKDYGFRDQVTRAGLSIPSNIAEGSQRATVKDCSNFLNYAKGSCGELKTQIHIGVESGLINRNLGERWLSEVRAISSMLEGLIRAKRTKILAAKGQG